MAAKVAAAPAAATAVSHCVYLFRLWSLHVSLWVLLLVQNSELLCLTYGSLVTQLLKDFGQVEAINMQLDKM